MAEPKDYELCISFTRSGINNRVPWVLVLYKKGSPKGVRLRVKAVHEEMTNTISKTNVNSDLDAPPPKYTFLARENAYVENYRCWSRVIIRSEMTKAEADECQRVIENQTLSETVDGFRDCQKWVVECLGPLGFIQGEVNLWDGLKAKNIWEIECTINDLGVKYFGLSFVRGPAYVDKDKAIRMGFGGLDEDKNAKSIIQAELNRLQELLDDNIATQRSSLE